MPSEHSARRQSEQNEERAREKTAELEEAWVQTLRRLARAGEYRDDPTGAHSERVGRTSGLIARELGWDETRARTLRLAATLHDIGNVGIPDSILLCSERLSREQFEVMKTHCVIGSDLLAGTAVPLLEMAAEIALTHHERWDGLGYPRGLSGEAIPVSGRIVSVADTWDALTTRRPYRQASTEAEALVEVERNAGLQFDPEVVEAFRRTLRAGG